MDAKRCAIQFCGWLALIAGYGLALLLIRGVFIGVTRGFGAIRSQAIWIVVAYLLYLAVAVYFFTLGRRTLSIAKGTPQASARFGWGRIVLGTTLLYTFVVVHFHLIPVHGGTTKRTDVIIFASVCCVVILSGIWRGFRVHRTDAA
jgi:hypothetical protein